MAQNPKGPSELYKTHQGNKKEISKSKIKNKIPIKKNRTEKGRPSRKLNGTNPHS